MKTTIGAWILLFVTPAMFAANILVARLAAGWLPPLALTFWRWKREAPASFLLGAIGMTLCSAAAYLAGEHTSAVA